MRILLIEPYYTGSHKVWADGYKKYSTHDVELLTLEGRHWKWRMHGASIELAQMLNVKYKNAPLPDLFFISDMLDLTTLKSLVRQEIANIPTAFYFHENQLSYPYTENDTDSKRVRDFHYGFINYTSALAADQVFFNSKAQQDSFFEALEDLLKRMPDYKGLETITQLRGKTSILPLGIEYNKTVSLDELETIRKQVDNSLPTILWTHRWEYDKNPDDFFSALQNLSESGYAFNLAVLGAKSPKPPKIFKTVRDTLAEHIVAFGKPDTYEAYIAWLYFADILPVTSVHETFGISLMEALHNGVRPLLPNRLSYPELVCPNKYPEFYYSGQTDLIEKLKNYIEQFNTTSFNDSNLKEDKLKLTLLSNPYDWNHIAKIYDETLTSMV